MSSSKNSSATTSTTTRKVLEYADWNPKAHKYMAPKVNSMGGKSVSLISTQTSRALHLNTPLMMTWGIADFTNDDGTSDGKFKISLNFPTEEYKTEQSDMFLKKMIDFQAQVIDDAVTNSELWFGKKKSKELVEDSFFPFLKYPKVKDLNGKSTGATDYTRAPKIEAKVPCYPPNDDPTGAPKWDCDLFDTNYQQIFPSDDSNVSPIDLVPKQSKIACTLQCTGMWVGGKGWGLTWKFISGVVKPKVSESVRGKCHITLSTSDLERMEASSSRPEVDEDEEEEIETPVARPVSAPVSTVVEDSDEEEDAPAAVAPAPEPPKVVKKVVKKKIIA